MSSVAFVPREVRALGGAAAAPLGVPRGSRRVATPRGDVAGTRASLPVEATAALGVFPGVGSITVIGVVVVPVAAGAAGSGGGMFSLLAFWNGMALMEVGALEPVGVLDRGSAVPRYAMTPPMASIAAAASAHASHAGMPSRLRGLITVATSICFGRAA